MKYFYGPFDGEEFPTQDKLFGFDQLMQFIMQYGDQALKAIEQMMQNPKDGEQSEMLEQLLRDGMLEGEAQPHAAIDQQDAAAGADGSVREPA